MQIFIDDLSVPALVVGVDLGASLELSPGGRAFIGFAGATGEAAENHDIQSFRFIPTSAPGFAVEFGPRFVGTWAGTDIDESNVTLTIRGSGAGGRHSVDLFDDAALVCGGAPASANSPAVVEGNTLSSCSPC